MTSTESLTIKPVTTKRDLQDFLDLPKRIYQGDPHWVPPLDLERKQHLSKKNPYFQHAEWQPWLALRDGRVVGRISAQVDQLHQETHNDSTGFFGFLEADDDSEIFHALLEQAESWLRERGMKRVQGPFSYGINDESGLLIDGFDTPPVAMMAHARPYYADRIVAENYQKAMDLLAYWITLDFNLPPSGLRLQERYSDRFKIRSLEKSRLAEELETLRSLFNDAWSGNWNFVPFTKAEFDAMGKDLVKIVPPDMIKVAEIDGEPEGMIVAFPNINEQIGDLNGKLLPFGWLKLLWRFKFRFPKTGRTVLMGIRHKHQNSMMGAALTYCLIDEVRKSAVSHGSWGVELSWILETNTRMRGIIESLGAKVYKTYRVYEKNLR